MYELDDIAKVGGSNAPGMSDRVLICLKREVLVIPPFITPVVNPGDSFRLAAGDITFIVGGGWVEVYVTKDTVQLMLKKVGQKDSRGWNMEANMFHPSLNPAIAELFTEDEDVLMALKKPDCTGAEHYVFGDTCRGIELSGDYDSDLANNESGRNGWAMKGMGYIAKWRHYSGEFTMKP